MKIFSWNVASSNGYREITTESLGLPNRTPYSSKDSDIPHVIAFGFQEVTALSELLYNDPYMESLKKLLGPRGYVKLGSEKLQGIFILVFVLQDLITQVRSMEQTYVKTGLGGLWGNKGGVAIRFSLLNPQVNLCLINAHLAAHDHKLKQRISDYHNIVNGLGFKSNVLVNDETFIFGDLNMRIDQLSANEINDLIIEGSEASRTKLLQNDQLNNVRTQGIAFEGFNEPPIRFWPTYKFKLGTNNYNFKRKPAFTDRILYKTSTGDRRFNNEKNTQVDEYKRHMDYFASDHKPVSASFTINLRNRQDNTDSVAFESRSLLNYDESDDEKFFVTFDQITRWINDEDNVVTFSYNDSDRTLGSQFISSLDKTWDWIGIYPAKLDDIEKWICYSYVNNSTIEEVTNENTQIRLSLKVNCLLVPGSSYRMVYFHETDTRSIHGISDPFTVAIN